MLQRNWRQDIGLIPLMLRAWSAAREIGENPLPPMTAKVAHVAASPELVTACDSLFTLTEAVLRRRLVSECCCSADLSADEAALLTMLQSGPTLASVRTGEAVAQGMPTALTWAVIAVRRALGDRNIAPLPHAGIAMSASIQGGSDAFSQAA